jgi:hypothetical protein
LEYPRFICSGLGLSCYLISVERNDDNRLQKTEFIDIGAQCGKSYDVAEILIFPAYFPPYQLFHTHAELGHMGNSHLHPSFDDRLPGIW